MSSNLHLTGNTYTSYQHIIPTAKWPRLVWGYCLITLPWKF